MFLEFGLGFPYTRSLLGSIMKSYSLSSGLQDLGTVDFGKYSIHDGDGLGNTATKDGERKC